MALSQTQDLKDRHSVSQVQGDIGRGKQTVGVQKQEAACCVSGVVSGWGCWSARPLVKGVGSSPQETEQTGGLGLVLRDWQAVLRSLDVILWPVENRSRVIGGEKSLQL